METLDSNCIHHISKYMGKDLDTCLQVNSKWYFIFKEHHSFFKPKQSREEIIDMLLNNLKLGKKYDLSKILHIYNNVYESLSKSENKMIHSRFLLKLSLDKPAINYYPLNIKNIIERDLQKLKLS